jgi:polysaccharide biosynthesis/export protein
MGSHGGMHAASKLVFLSLLTALSLFGPFSQAAGTEAAQPEAYLIQPGDVLQIVVWKEQDLQTEVVVRPDGGVSFPLSGDLKAAGSTAEVLRDTLRERLSKYIPDPVVTVTVKIANGNRIYVAGKVNRPGEFPLARPTDVMQALALAGGATPFAKVNEIRVIRREGGQQTVLSFRYDDVAMGRRLEQNILLRSGDTVVVP